MHVGCSRSCALPVCQRLCHEVAAGYREIWFYQKHSCVPSLQALHKGSKWAFPLVQPASALGDVRDVAGVSRAGEL